MTDKEKIRKEVEKIAKSINPYIRKNSEYQAGRFAVVTQILQYIDSLQEEPVSDDLEEAAKHYLYSNILYDDVYVGNPTDEDCIEMFKAGAKWQKEQMMKDAMEAVISQVPCSNEIIFYNPASIDRFNLPQEMNRKGLEKGDKVRLIIIKED